MLLSITSSVKIMQSKWKAFVHYQCSEMNPLIGRKYNWPSISTGSSSLDSTKPWLICMQMLGPQIHKADCLMLFYTRVLLEHLWIQVSAWFLEPIPQWISSNYTVNPWKHEFELCRSIYMHILFSVNIVLCLCSAAGWIHRCRTWG